MCPPWRDRCDDLDERWAEPLIGRELLPGFDHEADAATAATLVLALMAAPRPEDSSSQASGRAQP